MKPRTLIACVLGLALGAGPAAPTPAATPAAAPTPAADAGFGTGDLLFAPPSVRRSAFAAIAREAPTRRIRPGAAVFDLVPAETGLGPVHYELDGQRHDLEDFLAMRPLMGLIVVRGDRVLLEHYAPDHGPDTPWVSFSVSKSVTSMLIGAAVADGFIASVDEPVSHYLPRLRGTPYADVSIEQVLHMASGVAWNEDYADPTSDVARAGALNGLELARYLGRLERAHAPGEVFNYNTGETNLAGEILRAALGNNAATYLEHRIWRPFGMGSEATWLLDAPGGGETGGCCISATLRDYARIGLFALGGGRLADGTRVLPEDWMAASTTPSPAAPGYGYLWWLPEYGGFRASGIFGQRIDVDPSQDLVIAVHSNAPAAVDTAYHAHLEAVTRALRDAVAER